MSEKGRENEKVRLLERERERERNKKRRMSGLSKIDCKSCMER